MATAYENDSVSVQFSSGVSASGVPVYRIGTSSAVTVILEEGSGASVRNWGWNDNELRRRWAHPSTSPPAVRRGCASRSREDGASIDQIVLSPARYLSAAPGALKDDSTIVP